LSGLNVLRSLEVAGWVACLGDPHPSAVVEVFSTITSPVFSEVVVVLEGRGVWLPREVELFKILRTMSKIRPFKLVFLLEDPSSHPGELMRILDSENTSGFLDFLDSPPTIRTA